MLYSELKAQIADDLARADLTTQIDAAAKNAMRFYASRRFYFNESRSVSFATVIGQAIYDSATLPSAAGSFLANPLAIDSLVLIQGGANWPIKRVTDDVIELMATPARNGLPAVYSVYNRSLRLYPTPSAVLTVLMAGQTILDAPAADNVENAWTLDAAELIRCRTKRLLAMHVLKDMDLAQVMKLAEDEALTELSARTDKMRSTGRIRAEYL